MHTYYTTAVVMPERYQNKPENRDKVLFVHFPALRSDKIVLDTELANMDTRLEAAQTTARMVPGGKVFKLTMRPLNEPPVPKKSTGEHDEQGRRAALYTIAGIMQRWNLAIEDIEAYFEANPSEQE